MSLSVRVPAKVNLHLEVRGRRDDGHHDLRTVFASIGLWDELHLSEGTGLALKVEPEGAVAGDDSNLVIRAARVLASRFGVGSGAVMRLVKTIPVGGGLGGGSGDAAAALVGLAKLWGLSPSQRDLAEIAVGLGADVPFFLTGGLAWGEGRGDVLTPLPDAPPLWAVVVPGAGPISTAEVFRRHDASGMDEAPASEVYRWVQRGGDLPIASLRNDLERAVVVGWPDVGRRLAAVRSTGPLVARMSGSGASVFGLYDDHDAALRAAETLRGDRAIVAPLLRREEARIAVRSAEDSWRSPKSVST